MVVSPDTLEELIAAWTMKPEDVSVDVQDLDHYYGVGDAKKQVLFGNQLQIRKGEIVIMTGPSGSGKTTLLTLIGTLRKVQKGGIRIQDDQLFGATSQQINHLRKNIGFIFQAHNLFESLTAFQNVKMATDLVGMPGREVKEKIPKVLTRLGLGERSHYKPKSLSGGQKQRVAIARGIIHRPKLILADEPTAALDAKSGREVVKIFRELASENDSTILIVTHDDRILDVADRIVNMVDGNICSNVQVRQNSLLCEVLSKFEVFQGLQPKMLSQVADKMELRQYDAGQEVIRQGEMGEEFFVIGKGDVDVEVSGVKVNTLGQGDYFGEVSLIKEQPRNATIVASTPLTLFILDKSEFQQVVATSETFDQQIRRSLFGRS